MASGDPQYPTPNARYEHLFVVVRVDDRLPVEHVEDRVSLVATYVTEAEARVEVDRLNKMSGEKSCRYVVMLTRLKSSP